MLCDNCKQRSNKTPVRVVEVGRTDNHYIEVCPICAVDMCDSTKTHRRIAEQPQAEQTQ
jgi:protein-arginine kinase activator protein McsA